MHQEALISTNIKSAAIIIFWHEIVGIIYDSRWLLLSIIVCVVADFYFGRRENRRRYEQAKINNDILRMNQYRWRPSRAWRRTLNKLSDYFMWVILGTVIAYAILRPVGIEYKWGGIIATAAAILCESNSLCSHFFYLHSIIIEEKNIKGFAKAFIIAFAKKKNKDVGDAIEESLKNINTNENN